MNKKAIAGAIAFICTVSAFGAYQLLPKTSDMSDNAVITAYAEGETDTKQYNFETDYADTSYYTYSMTEVTGIENWEDNYKYKYGIYRIKATHKEDGKTVTDLDEYVIGIKSYSGQHLLEVTGCHPVDIPYAVSEMIAEKKIELADDSQCLAVASKAFSGESSIKSIDFTGVKYIGDNAFEKCPYITIETIPSSVMYMGKAVFKGSGLKTLTFENNVINIPESFCENTKISKVDFIYPQNVKYIGKASFANTVLTDYILPSSGTDVTIGEKAFQNCTQIKSLSLPGNTVAIDKNAFTGCIALSSLDVGSGMKNIGEAAFSECSALTSIKLNDVIEYLGKNAFMSCTSLVNAPAFPAEMGMDEGTFKSCSSLKNITLPSAMTTVPLETCMSCTSLTEMTLGVNISIIGKSAFNNCTNLQTVTMLGEADVIGESAFEKCTSLKALPVKTCAVVKQSAFEGCTALTDVDLTVTGWTDYLLSSGGLSLEAENDYKVTGLPNLYKESLPAFGHEVFRGCTGLKTASIDGVSYGSGIFYGCTSLVSAYVALEGYALTPSFLFYGCTSLTDLRDTNFSTINVVSESTFQNCSALPKVNELNAVIIEKNAFKGCTVLESICSGDISAEDYGASCFADCKNLSQKVNSTASTVGASAFANSGITSLYIEGTVGNTAVFGSKAFSGCADLVSAEIIIPEGIEYSVGSELFSNCTSLKSCKYTGTEIPVSMFLNCSVLTDLDLSNAMNVRKGAFKNCTSLVTIVGMKPLVSIEGEAFANCSSILETYSNSDTTFSGDSQYIGCESIRTAQVYALSKNMFKDCDLLNTVTLSDDITSIPQGAFQNCYNLSSINLGNIKTFGTSSMAGSGIASLDLSGINEIGTKAFEACPKLTTIKVDTDTISNNAFAKCTKLKSATISANKIGKEAFSGCSALSSVTFKNNDTHKLNQIDASAFQNTAMTYVILPETVDTIGKKAFGYSGNKTVLGYVVAGTPGTEAETYANDNSLDFADSKTYVPGSPSASANIGDVNNDGAIDSSDASDVLKEYAIKATGGSSSFTAAQRKAGDTNGDGSVDSSDASNILAYYAYKATGGKDTFKQFLGK